MRDYEITLANIDSNHLCSARVTVQAKSRSEAESLALNADYSTLEWTDELGNVVDWNGVDGTIVVGEE